ncbi:MAG TPA: lysophospholipid acyltransferase family protein [bacterium]|nr:lysophospholipid acyltransferase family protein [bacterium]HOL34762.1 lysophospholipid acyltransferase family protein [bacterium]HPP08472.1 lysophospholipid acyltransferase family protein [bacterium]
MKIITFLLKFISLTCLIFIYMMVSCFVTIFSKRSSRRKNLCLNCSYFSKIGLKFLGIRVKKCADISQFQNKSYFIVSNHVSYIDILVISSFFPASFITSVEVAKDVFLGTLAMLGGSLFVERRKKSRLIKDLETVSDVLESNLNVVLFPEGTSSDGEKILPFKKTLFRAAIKHSVPVLPLYLRYVSVDGMPVSNNNRDLIYWYGDMKFFPHFMSLLKLNSINANLFILPEISSVSKSSHQLASIAFQTISNMHQSATHM